MDSVTFPVFVLDENAIYLYQNAAAAEALKYRQDEIEGRELTELLDAEPGWVLAGFEQLKFTGHFSGPVLYRIKGGGRYRGDANVFMRTLPSGSKVAVSMVQPVSYGTGRSPILQTVNAFGLAADEIRLLQLISGALSDSQIAEVLGVQQEHVEQELQVMFKKMGVSSRTPAVVLALKASLIL
jgi:DNA-binding CsgD family transcriptional regulator